MPRIPPKVVPLRGGNRYQHVHTREVWNRHNGTNQSHVASELDWLVECHAANGEDNNCSDSEPLRSYFEWAKGHEGCGQHCNYLGMLGGCKLLTLRWRWLRRTAACACAVATGPAPGNELCIL